MGYGKIDGITRIIRVITVILFVVWTCLMLGEQINDELFIQCKTDDCTMKMPRCFALLIGYCVCFAPITIDWIAKGFRRENFYKRK